MFRRRLVWLLPEPSGWRDSSGQKVWGKGNVEECAEPLQNQLERLHSISGLWDVLSPRWKVVRSCHSLQGRLRSKLGGGCVCVLCHWWSAGEEGGGRVSPWARKTTAFLVNLHPHLLKNWVNWAYLMKSILFCTGGGRKQTVSWISSIWNFCSLSASVDLVTEFPMLSEFAGVEFMMIQGKEIRGLA